MHFPKHWARGEWHGRDRNGDPITRDAWGWSDLSETDARGRAEQRARRLVEDWPPNERPPGDYGYPDRPLREPVLRVIPTDAAAGQAVVTRNSYGCDVLNTERVLFIDVDLPAPPRAGLLASIAALFGAAKPNHDERARAAEAKVAQLRRWQLARPELTFRVYRTAGGLRYLLVSALAAPSDPVAEDALAELDVDPNYRRLCAQQKTFRARLTPKHWRCGLRKPPHRFPFANPKASARFEAWLERYRVAAAPFAVCHHLCTVGSSAVHPAMAPVLSAHDAATGVQSSRPLA